MERGWSRHLSRFPLPITLCKAGIQFHNIYLCGRSSIFIVQSGSFPSDSQVTDNIRLYSFSHFLFFSPAKWESRAVQYSFVIYFIYNNLAGRRRVKGQLNLKVTWTFSHSI